MSSLRHINRVTVDVSGDVTRDVHVVSGREHLGASLPPQLRSQSATLSGVVFEQTPDGPQGLSDVRVSWDDTAGADLELAATLTDSEGRYVLCGLDRNRPGGVSVSRSGYLLATTGVELTGAETTLDIELPSR